MLVLTRKKGEKLIINDNIEVVILETRGDAVKIGVKAPRNVSIYREEVYEEIKKSNVQSSKNVNVNDVTSAIDLLSAKPGAKKSYSDALQQMIQTKKRKD